MPNTHDLTKGFFVIPRCFNSIPHSDKFSKREAIIDLCSLATWKPYTVKRRGRKILLSSYQLFRSIKFFQKRWNQGEKWIRSFLADMQKREFLTYESSKLGTLISLNRELPGYGNMRYVEQSLGENTDGTEFLVSIEEKSCTEGKGHNTRSLELNKKEYYSKDYYRDIFDAINRIPILDILHHAGYTTFRKGTSGNVMGIMENGKKTDGYSVYIDKNYVRDFAKKGRPFGQPVCFIKQFHDLTSGKEIIEAAEHYYGFSLRKYHQTTPSVPTSVVNTGSLDNDVQKPENDLQEVHWNSLESTVPTEHQTEYLVNRGILASELKSILRIASNRLALAIKSPLTNKVVGIQTRESNNTGKNRYRIASGGTPNGYFYDFPHGMKIGVPTGQKILIVEGFTDYLSIRQITPYVIGIVSASSDCQDFSQFGKLGYEFVMIPDRDSAGEQLFEKLSRQVTTERISLNEVESVEEECKDVNDYLVKHGRTGLENLLRGVGVLPEL